LHPVLVHLPIAFILLLALLELLARSPRFKQVNASAGIILGVAVPASLFTALCGWLLSLGGGYAERLLQWHLCTALGTTLVFALAGVFYRLDLKKPYRWCLYSSALALVVASHFGGSLTHGSDYLARYAPGPLRRLLSLGSSSAGPHDRTAAEASHQPADPGDVVVFAGVIHPIFEKNCVACHGPEKSKAKLRLDSLEAALKGGENGPVILGGNAVQCPLIKRLRLPDESDDHMPPAGKPQPSAEDIALVEWWINAGAPADKKVKELKASAEITRILGTRFGAPAPVARQAAPKPLAEIRPLADKLADALGVSISALSPTDSWLQCNASVRGTNFGDAELGQLAPLGSNLRWLDLAGTAVTDSGLQQLSNMPNLLRLHLERTAVTDDGLGSLTNLAHLEYLDLYATTVTDDGLELLQTLPRLKRVFLWQTKVTPAAASAFIEARTDKAQLARWEDEIEALQARIRDGKVSAELGTAAQAGTAATSAKNVALAPSLKPINTQCPVSGKPADAARTVLYEGVLVAFCCDDCMAQFQKDPKPFLSKLTLPAPKENSGGSKK
jgi:uncharacterized membrane protein